MECKTKIKDSKSISIQKEWIEKLKEECFAMRKPYWAISFSLGIMKIISLSMKNYLNN